jgi:MSHA biogenesis protein MshP
MSAAQTKRGDRGFALMLAVFLIVTLAAIGMYLVTVSTGQSQAVSQDVQGVRAYQAARAGLEWGTYRRLINASCAASTPLPFANAGLSGFCAVVTCSEVTPVGGEAEGGATVHVYRITSTGCNATPCDATACPAAAPGPTYAERQLQITITQ